MLRIRSVVNGNVVDEQDDQARFLVNAGLFVFVEPAAEPAPTGPEAEPAPPVVTVRRSRRRT